MKAYIAQAASSTPAPPTPSPIAEWGLFGSLAVFLIWQGLQHFKQKDAAESKMVEELVGDLRTNNQQVLENISRKQEELLSILVRIQQSNTESVIEFRNSVQELVTSFSGHQAEIASSLRDIRSLLISSHERLGKLERQIDSLQEGRG